MSEDLTNLGNPVNARHDEELRNAPHVTPIPPRVAADDLFDDSVSAPGCDEMPEARGEVDRPISPPNPRE
jgi:hypothetical protein